MIIRTSKEGGTADLRQKIEERAYQIYLNRQMMGLSGDSFSDWTQAEQEIASQKKTQSKNIRKAS